MARIGFFLAVAEAGQILLLQQAGLQEDRGSVHHVLVGSQESMLVAGMGGNSGNQTSTLVL